MFNIEIEFFEKNGKKCVFIANNGSSGCEYSYETKEELQVILNDYINDMLDEIMYN